MLERGVFVSRTGRPEAIHRLQESQQALEGIRLSIPSNGFSGVHANESILPGRSWGTSRGVPSAPADPREAQDGGAPDPLACRVALGRSEPLAAPRTAQWNR